MSSATRCERTFARLLRRAQTLYPRFDARFVWNERAGQCAPGAPDPCRQFAWCSDGTRQCVGVSPRLELEAADRVEGVLRHELGHALLFHHGHASHRERDADTMAEAAFGRSIGYDTGDVQTIGVGVRPRPARLGA